ncbi:methyltransferase, TIGR04325 family [Yoonia sp. BS5-3]|uniref:Methyltransferase, TIGR04325 family n=1 Tax=Yoonia phaeophyticola TaxID=3137369 RepID=A0ABZ2V519_9RHOB
MSWRRQVRQLGGLGAAMPRALLARIFINHRRGARFTGVWQSRDAASAACPTKGYDDQGIADISFDLMCKRAVWDYPLLFWLNRLLPDHPAVLDAGGHMGTKYIAFSDLLDLTGTRWTVFDLPGIIEAAQARQSAGDIPAQITFASQQEGLEACDLLICSGLLQYLDKPFADFVGGLKEAPKYILLNKVATREGRAMFTSERIGQNRVPYHIRDRQLWEAEMGAMGYDVIDRWTIPELGHVIPTHPWYGRSESRGYVLKLRGAHGAPDCGPTKPRVPSTL